MDNNTMIGKQLWYNNLILEQKASEWISYRD